MKQKQYLLWLLAGFFLLLGILIYVCIIGYSFSAMICFGIAGVIAVYRLLTLLATTHKRPAAILRLLLSIFLCLGLLAAFATALPIARAAFADPAPNCQYIVVLGAGLHGTTPSMTLSDRLNAAADYLVHNPDTVCIVSGGQGPGEDMTEARCMYDILTARGIDSARIWMEGRSTSTYENLQFSVALIEEKTGEHPEMLGIISSEYHIYRACMTAEKLGIHPIGIPAKTSRVTLFLNYFFREIPAVWYYTISGGTL